MFYSTLCLKIGAYFQDIFALNSADHKFLGFIILHLVADSTWSNWIERLDTYILYDERSLDNGNKLNIEWRKIENTGPRPICPVWHWMIVIKMMVIAVATVLILLPSSNSWCLASVSVCVPLCLSAYLSDSVSVPVLASVCPLAGFLFVGQSVSLCLSLSLSLSLSLTWAKLNHILFSQCYPVLLCLYPPKSCHQWCSVVSSTNSESRGMQRVQGTDQWSADRGGPHTMPLGLPSPQWEAQIHPHPLYSAGVSS